MKEENYIECILSIIRFISEIDDNNYSTDANLNMINTLGKYGYNMVTFTEHISENKKLWEKSAKEFFSNHEKCLYFFRSKLRKIKLKRLNLL